MRTLGVFAAGLLIDVSYVSWFRAVDASNPALAVLWSMTIGACGLLGVTSVVSDKRMAAPWLLGLGCGTLLGMAL